MEATFVKDLDKGSGTQKLWKLSEPYAVRDWDDSEKVTVEHVVTSATTVLGTPETYVFPSDENGDIVEWGELPGSFKGALDHDQAIEGFTNSNGRWSYGGQRDDA